MQQHLDELADLARIAGCSRLSQRAGEIAAWTTRSSIHVVVCGEFNRGKSTLVNALLGVDVCPTDILPETAVPAVFEYADPPTAWAELTDGRREELSPTPDGLRRFSASKAGAADSVRLVTVGLPSPLLAQGIVLIDTPGVNDLSTQRVEVTYGFLPLCDVAVLVLDATAPVTRSEAAFLSEQVLPNVFDRIVYVLGKADRVDADELQEVVSGAKERIEQVTKRPAVVLALSARHARAAPEELAALRSRITALAASNASNRQVTARERTARLASELEDELTSRLESLDLSPEEREHVAQQAVDARLRGTLAAEKFREYIDLFGRRTLSELTGASLTHLEKRTIDDLLQQLSLLEGAIDKFVNRHLPHQVKSALRSWSDAKSREIEAFLTNLVGHLSEEFATAFAVPLRRAALPPRLLLPEHEASQGQLEADRMQNLILHQLLPTTAPMLAGLLLAGPIGMIVGGMVGRFAEAQLRENRVASEKAQAEELLRESLPNLFAAFRQAIDASLGSWFDHLQRAIASEVLLRQNDLDQRVREHESQRRAPLEQARARVQTLKRQIMEAGNV